MDAARRPGPLLAWLAGLAALLASMTALGGGALAGPPLTEPAAWADWAATRPAPDAAMAVLRLVVLALAWYLLVVTVVAVAVRLGRAGALVAVADVVTVPFVRSVVQAGLGVGLAGATVVAAVQPAQPAPPPAPVVLVASTAPVLQRLPDAASAPPVLRRLDVAPPAPAPAPTWTVAPGDHLWSVAERVLAGEWGRPPADAEVAPYWSQVVERNRAGLADPGNPDLLFPGQVLALPPAPPAP